MSMFVLNLGCGYHTSDRCTNIDWSIPVRLKGSALGRRIAPLVLTGDRRTRFEQMSGTVLHHDLRRGVPFPDGSADAVYSSHVLEHLDREVVPVFLAEILRVLKPGGVVRVVVPDLERQARTYVASLDSALAGEIDPDEHEAAVFGLIEQLVRREAAGTAQRGPVRRRVENVLLGDARRRGETHRWMWDRVSLPAELVAAGFREPALRTNTDSAIPDWRGYQLDETADGAEYLPGSMYVEAVK